MELNQLKLRSKEGNSFIINNSEMLNFLSRISLKRVSGCSFRLFASPRLLQIQSKIEQSQFENTDLPQIIQDVKEAIIESRHDLAQFQAPKTLGRLIQELNTNAKTEAFNEMIKLMNEVADLEAISDSHFQALWKDIEGFALSHTNTLDAQTLVNTLYYFTKMQEGSTKLFTTLQEALNKSDLNPPQASRTLLAVIMSGHINKALVEKLVGIIEQNINVLQEKDIYYVAMTLPQPEFNSFIQNDLEAKVQRKCQEYLGAFDLLQLSQIMTAFQNTASPQFVSAYQAQIKESLENFKKYKDKIKVDNFMGDLIRNFGSAAYCVSTLSPNFWKEAEAIASQNLVNIPDQTMEMLMIAFLRSGTQIQPQFGTQLVQEILRRNLIQDKKVNELGILSFLTEYRIDSQQAYFQLLGNVVEELKKGTDLNVPLDILAIISFSFSRRFGPSQEPRVVELYKLLVQHIEASKDQGSFATLVNVLSFLGNAEIKDEQLKNKFQDQILKMDLKTIPFGVEQFLTLLSILIQGEMFNEKLWEQAYEAVQINMDSFERIELIRLFVTCSQLGLARPELWEKVKIRVSKDLNRFTPEQFLEMHNCIAIEELEIPGFWDKAKQLLKEPLPLPEIVNLGWSIGKIQDKDPQFWQAFETYLIQSNQEITLYDLQNVLLALGKNKQLSSKFWAFVRAKIKERLQVEKNTPDEVLSMIMTQLKEQDSMENGPLLVELNQVLTKGNK